MRGTSSRRRSEKFDAITSDPLDPWVKGAAMLYTVEFFEMAKEHLNPGGVVTLFVQLYESNTEAVKSEIGTFLEVFPNGIVLGNTNEGKGYDLVLLGQSRADEDRRRRDPGEAAAAGVRADGAVAARDRHELRGRSVLRPTPAASRISSRGCATRTINRDRNLRLQYLAGLGLNLYQADVIYADMLRHVSKMPEDLFIASEATKRRCSRRSGRRRASEHRQIRSSVARCSAFSGAGPSDCAPWTTSDQEVKRSRAISS